MSQTFWSINKLALVGGLVTFALGLIGVGVRFGNLFNVLKVAMPTLLLLVGAFFIYYGFTKAKAEFLNKLEPLPSETKSYTSLSEIMDIARQHNSYLVGMVVVFYHAVMFIVIGITIWMYWEFQPINYKGIVGWITVEKYPKHQDLLAFYGALVVTIISIIVGWMAWLLIAKRLNKSRRISINCSLNLSSIICCAYVLVILLLVLSLFIVRVPLFLTVCAIFFLLSIIFFFLCCSFSKNKFQRFFNIANILQEPSSLCQLFRNHYLNSFFFLLVLPFLIYLYLYNGNSIDYMIDFFHEGEMLAPLNAVWHGAIPFRDIYFQHGLFTNLGISWLSAWWFGNSLEAFRATLRLIEPLGYVALYYLGLTIFSWWPMALILVFLTSANYLVSYRYFFSLLAMAVIVYCVRRIDVKLYPGMTISVHKWLIIAGVLTVLSFLLRVEIGIFTLIACTMTLLLQNFLRGEHFIKPQWDQLIYYLSGVACGCLPFILTLGYYGAFSDMVVNSYNQCAYHLPVWGFPLPNLSQALHNPDIPKGIRAAGRIIWRWYCPIVIMIFTAGLLTYRLLQRKFWENSGNYALLLIWFFCIFNFRTALGRSDYPHLIEGITFIWVILAMAGESVLSYIARLVRKPALLSVCYSLIVLALLIYSSNFNLKEPKNWLWSELHRFQVRYDKYAVNDRLGRLNIDQAQLAEMRSLVSFVQNNSLPDEPIYDFSNNSLYYYLANRPCPTKYYQPCYAVTEEMQKEVVRDMQKAKVNLVIYRSGTDTDAFDGISQSERTPIIAKYLSENFHRIIPVGKFTIIMK